jgi:hypothetical protein
MTTTPVLENAGKGIGALPADLRSWWSEAELVRRAFEAGRLIGGRESDPRDIRGLSFVEVSHAVMLPLMTYCYLVGHRASEDIEWAIETDPTVRGLCNQTRLHASMIREFRRLHRHQIEQCIIHVLMDAILQSPTPAKHGATSTASTAEAHATAQAWTRQKIDLAIVMDASASD